MNKVANEVQEISNSNNETSQGQESNDYVSWWCLLDMLLNNNDGQSISCQNKRAQGPLKNEQSEKQSRVFISSSMVLSPEVAFWENW